MDTHLRYRSNITPMRSMPALTSGPSFTPQTSSAYRPQLPLGMSRGPTITPLRPPLMAPPIRTVKPIVQQNRSIVEKVVDYMVGDGPNNRYALICIHCYSHNGMALKEEFEYIAFRCCYCKGFNPARKMRPQPPRLDSFERRRSSSSLMPLIDEPESDTDSEKGRKSAEDSTRISEIANQSDNERQSDDHQESESRDNKETIDNKSMVDKDSYNTLTSVTESEVESKDDDYIREGKSETNKQDSEENRIPFIDDSNDSSL